MKLRQTLSAAFALSLIAGLGFAAAPVAAQDSKELVVVASGGAFEAALKKHFYDRFENSSDNKVVHVAAGTAEQFARLHAMIETGNVEWDLVTATPINLMRDRKALQRLDCSRLPNASAFGVQNTCSEYGMLRTIGATVLVYNTEMFPNGGPENWVDFWNVEQFPGPRCLPGGGWPGAPINVLMAALLADGVPQDKLFPMDVQRGASKLEELKEHVAVWWTTGDQSMATMRNRECAATLMWSGRAIQLINQDQPVTLTWNQSFELTAYWAIAKDAPNLDLAYEFLNFFMTDPKAHLAFSSDMVYDTSSSQAISLIPEDQLKYRSGHEPNLRSIIVPDHEWVVANFDSLQKTYEDVLTR